MTEKTATESSKNVALQGLARGLEVYVMTNRDGDAFDLALLIDNLIKERISEAMQPAAPESRDAPMRVQAHVYVVEPLCEEAAEEIERLRAALEQCNEHRDDPHKIIGIVDAALAGMPPYNFKRNADDETDSGI